MNFWVSIILTISEGWKGCGWVQTLVKICFLILQTNLHAFWVPTTFNYFEGGGKGGRWIQTLGCMTQFRGEHTVTSHFPTLGGRCVAPNIYPLWRVWKGCGVWGFKCLFFLIFVDWKKNEWILSSNHFNHFWGVERVGVTWAQLFTHSREGGKGGGSNVW